MHHFHHVCLLRTVSTAKRQTKIKAQMFPFIKKGFSWCRTWPCIALPLGELLHCLGYDLDKFKSQGNILNVFFLYANHSIDYTWHDTPVRSFILASKVCSAPETYTSTEHTSVPRNQDFYLANCKSCRT